MFSYQYLFIIFLECYCYIYCTFFFTRKTFHEHKSMNIHFSNLGCVYVIEQRLLNVTNGTKVTQFKLFVNCIFLSYKQQHFNKTFFNNVNKYVGRSNVFLGKLFLKECNKKCYPVIV